MNITFINDNTTAVVIVITGYIKNGKASKHFSISATFAVAPKMTGISGLYLVALRAIHVGLPSSLRDVLTFRN